MNKLRCNILIVGGGPAGLSAAVAASNEADITLVDDNPQIGGQIWRAELGKIRSMDAKLVGRLDTQRITMVRDAPIFGAESQNRLLAVGPLGRLELEFERLIIATGARERFLPFPGWTLPGVYGVGGLQAIVKGGLSVERSRVLVAGTGPLLLAVADYLLSQGAKIVAIAEQAPLSKINRFALGLWHWPSKVVQAAQLRSRLRGIPYLTDCWVTSAQGDGRLRQITLTRKGRPWDLECDYLACGYYLVPNLELASLHGCEIENGVVRVNEFQETSVKNVFCAGEPTGIGGLEASLIEGEIAGLAATGQTTAARGLLFRRQMARRFGDSLNNAFELRSDLKSLAEDQTIVCRCEDVPYARLIEYSSFRDAKLMTRCGMGACQGRICGAATEFIFDWNAPVVRPPIFPVRMEDL